MISYNVRWVESGEWQSHEGFKAISPIVANDILIMITGDPVTAVRLITLRVLQRVITDPVTLICAMTQNPLEEPELDP